MLEARGVTIGYSGAPPLFESLNFTLAPGELVALGGPNGHGKSSLCLALAGLIEPRAGEVTVDGEPCHPLARARALVGMLFQEPDSQLVTTSVEAEIAFPLENLGWERVRIDARVSHLLSEFGLGHLVGRSPEGLSGGEKSRLALAAALAAGPRYLILDEPEVYLDAVARRRLREVLAREGAGGLGILWVTQLEEERSAARRRLVLAGGELRAVMPDEPPDQAAPEPAHRSVAAGPESPRAGPASLSVRGLSFSYAGAGSHFGPWASSHQPARGGAPDLPGRPAPPLLAGIDLDLRPGETLFIGGASGSGKTTLLLLLAGVLEPRAGSVSVEAGGHAPPLGVALQSPEDQLVCPTVLEDVALGPTLAGVGAVEAATRAREALNMAGLDADRVGGLAPSGLSHGQRRRAAWAGIWALGARFWLLDEPTAGLDRDGVLVLRNAVREFTSAGGSVVIVNQDPRLSRWAGRRLRLADGRLAEESHDVGAETPPADRETDPQGAA